MPKRILKALVGTWKPRTPKRSLPSYHDPTPETNPKLSREEEAELALNRTAFTPGTPLFLIAVFLATITSVPVIQFAAEWRVRSGGGRLPMLDVFRTISPRGLMEARSLQGVWQSLPHAEQLKSAERELESDSVVSQWLLPSVQSVLVGKLGAGNEQVYLGRAGWLFYRPDVDYVTGPGFLAESQLGRRSHAARIQPDPIKAIVQFRDQLAARGIDLVIVPAPTKASVEGEMLSAKVAPNELLQNPSFVEFARRLHAAGVRVFDPTPLLMQQKSAAPGKPIYLQTDTHWRPETMRLVAQQLADTLALPAVQNATAPQVSETEITAIGDVARMLKLPASQPIYAPETVITRQVTAGNNFWRPSPEADVLLLGDSFANIFSLEALGWGESAGLPEHLSAALAGRPLDCILRNSDGAFATREMLANELARGRDRLAGKKLVIWEFAARELAFGNWKMLDLQLGQATPARFYAPSPNEQIEASGIVESVSVVPRPGSVPYQDHIMAVQVSALEIAGRKGAPPLQAIVYMQSMKANVWTPAARLRPGDRVRLRLRAWSDVASQYEQINRSEIDDPELQLEEPAWGEISN